MKIIPSGGPLGVEVRGIDMRVPLSAEEVATIRQAWNDHLVLAVRGQISLSLDDHMAFSRHFGELAMSPPSPVTGKRGEFKGVPPEIAVVSNIEVDSKPIGALGTADVKWHTDSSFFEVPPAGGLLRAIEVPDNPILMRRPVIRRNHQGPATHWCAPIRRRGGSAFSWDGVSMRGSSGWRSVKARHCSMPFGDTLPATPSNGRTNGAAAI
jgi:alpha-ketoglutarate-dependent taurine dioxygenase